jgi:hypothetical protein
MFSRPNPWRFEQRLHRQVKLLRGIGAPASGTARW